MKKLTVRFWSYDVWGNARDGFEVNDRRDEGRATITLRTWENDKALFKIFKRMLGLKAGLHLSSFDIDGDDTVVYYNLAKNSYPVGEVQLES